MRLNSVFAAEPGQKLTTELVSVQAGLGQGVDLALDSAASVLQRGGHGFPSDGQSSQEMILSQKSCWRPFVSALLEDLLVSGLLS